MIENYWWIVARDTIKGGQRFLIFGGRDETEARTKGLEMCSGEGLEWELRRFPSRDVNACSHMLKYGIASKSRDIRTANKRLGHSKSMRRRTGQPPPQQSRGIFG